jgi:hypothetical protein
MFGQTRAYSALMPSHFSSPASVLVDLDLALQPIGDIA